MEERVLVLKDLLRTQMTDGTWDYDAYQFGMANGMVLALSVMEGGELATYLDPPKMFHSDRELLDKLNNSSIIVHKEE